jgi:hypothetical protein
MKKMEGTVEQQICNMIDFGESAYLINSWGVKAQVCIISNLQRDMDKQKTTVHEIK